jgi:uncharacterized membrane protein YkoI
MKLAIAGISATVAAVLAAPVLFAQTPNATATELDAKQIIAKLESAGYSSISDVEKDDGVWEVDAVNSAGKRVEVDVDPVSGDVLQEHPDDND